MAAPLLRPIEVIREASGVVVTRNGLQARRTRHCGTFPCAPPFLPRQPGENDRGCEKDYRDEPLGGSIPCVRRLLKNGFDPLRPNDRQHCRDSAAGGKDYFDPESDGCGTSHAIPHIWLVTFVTYSNACSQQESGPFAECPHGQAEWRRGQVSAVGEFGNTRKSSLKQCSWIPVGRELERLALSLP